MANGFIKKNWQASAGQNALNAALRIGGGIGASALFAKVFTIKEEKNSDGTAKLDKDGKQVEDRMLYNIGGPLMLIASVLGDMMIEDSSVRSICQGVATVAGIHSIAVIAGADGNDPENIANKLGLHGFGDMSAEAKLMGVRGVRGVNGCKGLGTTTTYKSGVKALGATDVATQLKKLQGNNPTRYDRGSDYNNDWEYLAKNVEVIDKISKTKEEDKTPQTTEERAAALFGTSDEEAALLMGMF